MPGGVRFAGIVSFCSRSSVVEQRFCKQTSVRNRWKSRGFCISADTSCPQLYLCAGVNGCQATMTILRHGRGSGCCLAHLFGIISGRSRSGLARRFATGRCCVVLAISSPCNSGKAVPALLSSWDVATEPRAGSTPQIVVPWLRGHVPRRQCREPSATQVQK